MSHARSVAVRAPSNIALMKYMGKIPGSENLAVNPSLSMTLRDLCTVVEISDASPGNASSASEVAPSGAGAWISESPRVPIAPFRYPLQVPSLSSSAAEKFTAHVERFKCECSTVYQLAGVAVEGLNRPIEIRSANTFPHSSGIASSASSFAALTAALYYFFASDRDAARRSFDQSREVRELLARISRKGSGSSCRSFFGPFTEWDGEFVASVDSTLPPMTDLVCILSDAPKNVSSSEAHRRVTTSRLWGPRLGAVGPRHHAIRDCVREGIDELPRLSKLVLTEALEMHELFHTAEEPFQYMTEETRRLLKVLDQEFGPRVLLTLDAGPNIHVLTLSKSADEIRDRILVLFPELKILRDESSMGPELIASIGAEGKAS